MDLSQKLTQARKWIIGNLNDRGLMLVVTLIFGIIGASGNPIFLALALLPAYRLGWLEAFQAIEAESDVVCGECEEPIGMPYESSRDHTENRVRLVDHFRSKD